LGNLSVLGECISHTLPSSGQCTESVLRIHDGPLEDVTAESV